MDKKLYRITNDRVLGGVAAGLARYFDIDVTWMRILFILATIFGASGLLIYIILWIAIPEQPFGAWNFSATTDYKVQDPNTQPDLMAPKTKRRRESGFISGVILIFLGTFFLLDQFDWIPYWFSFGKLWPLALIIPGLVMLLSSKKANQPLEAPKEAAVADEVKAPVAKKDPVKKPSVKKPVAKKTSTKKAAASPKNKAE